jgi:hypothetical protein
MKVTTVMVIILIAWCAVTVLKTGAHLPPLPSLDNMKLDHEFLGWLTGTRLSHIMWIVALVGMGHSVLAMIGEETLAQVNREIESPTAPESPACRPGDFCLQPRLHIGTSATEEVP